MSIPVSPCNWIGFLDQIDKRILQRRRDRADALPARAAGLQQRWQLGHHPIGTALFYTQMQAIAKQLHVFHIFMLLRQMPQLFVRLAHETLTPAMEPAS